jgi:hypothetical protein
MWFGIFALVFGVLAFTCFLTFVIQSAPTRPPHIGEPWSVVCSDAGNFSFTDSSGYVFPEQFDSLENAILARDGQRRWSESTIPENTRDIAAAKWTVCPGLVLDNSHEP